MHSSHLWPTLLVVMDPLDEGALFQITGTLDR